MVIDFNESNSNRKRIKTKSNKYISKKHKNSKSKRQYNNSNIYVNDESYLNILSLKVKKWFGYNIKIK